MKRRMKTAAAFAAAFLLCTAFCSLVLWSGRAPGEAPEAAAGREPDGAPEVTDESAGREPDGASEVTDESAGRVWGEGGESAETASPAAAGDLPVIVIDAGHGGKDGGASSPDGTEEKDINLQIALKLAEEMRGYPLRVVLTRTDDSAVLNGEAYGKRRDLLNRKKIIEEARPRLTVSIHLNSFPQDASVCGPQVFYAESWRERTECEDGEQSEQGSKEFAGAVQKSLKKNLPGSRARVVKKKNDVLLLRDPDYPIILVECGFLSNAVECEKLKDAEYQGLLASAIWEGINEILCLEKEKSTEIVESANSGR